MRIRVLGSAAGGGFPQWNCACPNCSAVRAGSSRFSPRTQDSIAVGSDEGSWVLLNASPDVLHQIERAPALQPREGRKTPIRGIVLTNGDLDHCLGLLMLRESTPLVLYATKTVYQGLWEQNVFFRTLERFQGHVRFVPLEIGSRVSVFDGVSIEPFALAGKVPKHLEGRAAASPEDNVGLIVRDDRSRATAVYAGAAAMTIGLEAALNGASALFFDGTFWSSDELIRLGLGTSRAEDMAHLPIGGEGGSLAALGALSGVRKVFTHVNNTNPILDSESPERGAVERAGWEVATDGMELVL
jgi:pyrroloquinoline quinone biosynthesis protein B